MMRRAVKKPTVQDWQLQTAKAKYGIDHALQSEKAIREGHVCPDAVVEELGYLNLFGNQQPGHRSFYQEFKRTGDAEYCRSVLLQG